MTGFFQLVLAGLGFGGIYALAALGLTLIYKTSNVVNFAYGAMATVVAMAVWTFQSKVGLPIALAWVLAVVAGGLLGAASELAFLRRVEAATTIVSVVMTLGLLLLIEGLTGVVWGYGPKAVPPVLGGPSVTVGQFSLSRNELFVVALTVVLGAALYVFYERTRLGLAGGIAVTGVAATLAAPAVGLTPNFMDGIAVYAFSAAVLGGFGSLLGAVVGGFLVGILSNLVAGYLSTNLQLTLMFALIVVVLYLRPDGLFGRATRARV
jgi:branched-chain amino acid transport system permease protein